MTVTFPNAVIWDNAKKHHVAVIVCRRLNRVDYFCADCDYETTVDITMLDDVRSIIKDSDNMQVVFWGETDD
jgi:hypothetical protein